MNKVRVHYDDNLSYYDIAYFLKDYINEDTIIVCIGTDRCIGDCLGPLVGTLLDFKNFPLKVYGTISNPIHALNIDKKLKEIKKLHPKSNIIGIDACLGDEKNIGEIQSRNSPIHPGKGVGKSLPQVGETSIIGIVDSSDKNELFTNRNIRLDLIVNMSKVIVHSLIHSYYLYKVENKNNSST
ncbi:spore protease YyaC [Clostridium botulinum]|uniref:Sporulation protein n=1 Tax=Clostridium botulinum C/D str. DC5 TaxID=1443128 RepID=A0A0A0IGK3_CLOBO|nr:spore protease YyaC [Clostridium botulinum]KEI00293.1 sporulation protein [Clostridium botulinum C/D str. BKT75002]KEI08914.1 sporulation protein [Clostridium botulinum C/D str. BKT2873]KGM93827.1 sporulation protein [Clostridium botulinum D str. CCUG 7971]KGM99386.1 sporulation protein [Clostridium botulinum C/D str. DC5]KOC51168.1 sporulation protein [Clostridium botulinum]